MRFPWQKRKVEQPTDFPLKLNTDNLNWCRDARLLLIEGNGTLKWESRGRNEDWSQQYALTLRGTPLIVHNAPECPTCAGLLATGYGLDKADAPELQQISDVINVPYVDLDTSIASMAPLLGLLSSGLYVIAEGDRCFSDIARMLEKELGILGRMKSKELVNSRYDKFRNIDRGEIK